MHPRVPARYAPPIIRIILCLSAASRAPLFHLAVRTRARPVSDTFGALRGPSTRVPSRITPATGGLPAATTSHPEPALSLSAVPAPARGRLDRSPRSCAYVRRSASAHAPRAALDAGVAVTARPGGGGCITPRPFEGARQSTCFIGDVRRWISRVFNY